MDWQPIETAPEHKIVNVLCQVECGSTFFTQKGYFRKLEWKGRGIGDNKRYEIIKVWYTESGDLEPFKYLRIHAWRDPLHSDLTVARLNHLQTLLVAEQEAFYSRKKEIEDEMKQIGAKWV